LIKKKKDFKQKIVKKMQNTICTIEFYVT